MPTRSAEFSKDKLCSCFYLRMLRRISPVGYYTFIHPNQSLLCRKLSFAASKRRVYAQMLLTVTLTTRWTRQSRLLLTMNAKRQGEKPATTHCERFSVVLPILLLSLYLVGSQLTVRTDHETPKWLLTLSNACGNLELWILQLLQFEFDKAYHEA